MQIVICDDVDDAFRRSGELERLKCAGNFEIHNTLPSSLDATSERLAGADIAILVRDRTILDRRTLAALPALRLIAVTPGPNRIDIDAATELGIAVALTPASSAASIAEHVYALILTLARRVVPADGALRAHRWEVESGMEIEGKTLGILGLGRTGSAVAKRASAFGLNVLAWGPTLTAERARAAGAILCDVDTLFGLADIVSVHLRRSEWSRNFVNAQRLALMKSEALLIDISWSGIVDHSAVAAALSAGRLGGAGVDFCDLGPVDFSDPLLATSRTVLTPHLAWRTAESYRRFTSAIVRDVLAYTQRNPANVINPAALAHARHADIFA